MTRYKSEISRNRLRTNWVAVSDANGTGVSPKLSLRVSTTLLVGGLVVLAGGALMFLSGSQAAMNVHEMSTGKTQISDRPSAATAEQTSDVCDEAYVAANFNATSEASRLSEISLGGERFSRFTCTSATQRLEFLVEESFQKGKWQIKKISRPPAGDREISLDN